MQSHTVSVRVFVSDDGTLTAQVAGYAELLEAEDIVDLHEQVERAIHATYGERRRISLMCSGLPSA